MDVVVTGASGNVGSQVVRALLDGGVAERVTGVVRRPPTSGWPAAMRWIACDIGAPEASDVLRRTFAGADAVVHLAWQIQPSRDLARMRATNVDGSRRVFEATVAAGVPTLVHASSIGAYSAGPKDRAVDESWPTDGVPTSAYSRHKSAVERILDDIERDAPQLRVARLRPGLIFQAGAASEISRYFLGPFVPLSALRRRFLPVVPVFDRMVFQAVHAEDVAAAYVAAVTRPEARGAFNIAADPVIDGERLASTLGARPVKTPLSAIRAAADAAWRSRLQPTDPGWVDLAAAAPVMDTSRARSVLGWTPRHTSVDALVELVDAMAQGAGMPSAPLRSAGSLLDRAKQAASTAVHGGAGDQNP